MDMSVQSVGESIESAQKHNIIPDQEYLLQGSVVDSSVNVLLSRLRGLCDNADTLPATFHDQEIVYLLKDPGGGTTVGPGSGGTTMLRVRRALDAGDQPWQLRYVGQPDLSATHALLRNCLDMAVSGNICEFLHEMGAKVDHEFVCKGHIMRKGRIRVTVFKMYKVAPKNPKESVEAVSKSHVVELSTLTTRADEACVADLKIMADQLRPLVALTPLDYRRVQC